VKSRTSSLNMRSMLVTVRAPCGVDTEKYITHVFGQGVAVNGCLCWSQWGHPAAHTPEHNSINTQSAYMTSAGILLHERSMIMPCAAQGKTPPPHLLANAVQSAVQHGSREALVDSRHDTADTRAGIQQAAGHTVKLTSNGLYLCV
jgi:hypothetical protein